MPSKLLMMRLLKVYKRKENLPTLREYLKWLMKKVDQKSEGELILDWEKSVILNSIKRMVLAGNTGARQTPHGRGNTSLG